METVTIAKEEYESLKEVVVKLQFIDRAIHDDLNINELMQVQEKQKSFQFLHDKREDIYTEEDLKEKWNAVQ